MGMGPPQHNPDALASGQSEYDHSIAFFDVALIQARRASEGIYKPDAQAREYTSPTRKRGNISGDFPISPLRVLMKGSQQTPAVIPSGSCLLSTESGDGAALITG